jgi:hypothetical protein
MDRFHYPLDLMQKPNSYSAQAAVLGNGEYPGRAWIGFIIH